MDALSDFFNCRSKIGLGLKEEYEYKRLKFIARSLGVFPAPEEVEKSREVRKRMGVPVGYIEIHQTYKKERLFRIVKTKPRQKYSNPEADFWNDD